MELKDQLKQFIDSTPIINTHSHHMPDAFFKDMTLNKLFKNSYVDWSGVPPGNCADSKKTFMSLLGVKSYYVWLEKAIRAIYGIDSKISSENWDEISGLIGLAHQKEDWHIEILQEYCHYERSILDAYWDAGSDNQHTDIFSATFRIDTFLFGYDPNGHDHNDISFLDVYGCSFSDIDSFIGFMEDTIKDRLSKNCVALKSAIAYDRGIDFVLVSKQQAEQVFVKASDEVNEEDKKAFQDYIFFEICRIAADCKVPFQIHTGLGKLEKTNPMQLQKVINSNPETKFVLFHGGFPWTDEISGLLHVYQNVYVDLCWLPIISPTAARQALSIYLEVAVIDRIAWGCDTLTSEESYGALLALKEAMADVLCEKIISGYMDLDGAREVIKCLLYENPKDLYNLR